MANARVGAAGWRAMGCMTMMKAGEGGATAMETAAAMEVLVLVVEGDEIDGKDGVSGGDGASNKSGGGGGEGD